MRSPLRLVAEPAPTDDLAFELAAVRQATHDLVEQVAALQSRLRKGDPLPGSVTARQLGRERALRFAHLPAAAAEEPGWSILLLLVEHDGSARRVAVSAACQIDGVAPTTALRHVAILVSLGLVERQADRGDRRRCWLALTAAARLALNGYLAAVARARGSA